MSFLEAKNKDFRLKKELDLLLKKIESVKGAYDMYSILEMIGENFEKIGFMFIFSIPSRKRKYLTIKYLNNTSKASGIIFKEGDKIVFDEIPLYEKIFTTRKSSFNKQREKLFYKTKVASAKNLKINSIITPLVFKNLIVGFLEIFSEKLRPEDATIIDNFSKKLVLSIANIILFNEVQKSEIKYRNLFEKAKDGFYILNGRMHKFTDVNKSLCDISGYTRGEMLQMNVIMLFEQGERKKIKNYIENRLVNKELEKEVPRTYETKMLTKNKEVKDIELNVMQFISEEEWFVAVRDVTEKNKIKKDLEESKKKYKELITNASDIILSINKQGFIVFVNRSFENILGYSLKESKHFHFSQLIHPEDHDRVIKTLEKRMEGINVPLSIEFKTVAKSEEIRTMNMTGSLITKNDKIVGVQAILRDVTENKKLLEQIENSKRHYKQVIDTIQDSICVVDKDLKVVSANKVFAKNVDIDIKKIKNKKCNDVFYKYNHNLFVNDCLNNNCEKKCRFIKSIKRKKEDSYIKKSYDNGRVFYYKISIFFNKNREKEKNQVVITIRDITKRKTAENSIMELNELNKSIMDNIPIGIITINLHGIITSANNYSIKISNNSNLAGMSIYEGNFFHQKNLKNKYKELLRSGKSFVKLNCKTSKNKGDNIYINIIAVPIRNKKNKISGAVLMAWDNTEANLAKRKIEALNEKLEKKVTQRTWQLAQVNKKLAKAIELKSKFISDASHELRTPLTIIQGNIDLAIQENQKNKQKSSEEYHTIYKEVKRMSGILSDLTILTNADSSNEKLESDLVFPVALIKNVVSSLQVLANQKNIKLEIKNREISKNLYIKGDETKLEKLFLNIVRNAIKYTENNGWVVLELKKRSKGIKIIVEDNGIGIPKQDLPYIFERFYRVDKARSREEGGTGLGLSICKWIIEAHKGEISVESEEGVGTKFIIKIPYDFKNKNHKFKLL